MKMSEDQKEYIREFNILLDKGEYSFKEEPCLCGNDTSEQIADRDRYGFWHPVKVCRVCGLVRNNPRMTDESYQNFYSSDYYRKVYGGENYLAELEKRMSSDFGQHVYNDISLCLNPQSFKNVLEFGCAGGWNLQPFARAGLSVRGYDYSPSLVKLGQKFGLDLRVGSIGDIEGKYDLIILNHVIEHFTDFFGSMERLTSHINPNGYVYIGVPNIDNYGQAQLQNAHIYYFSPRTFKYYMSRCGINLIRFGQAQGIHMYGIFQPGQGTEEQINLDSEFETIMSIVQKAKIRHKIGNMLKILRIKGPIQKIWNKFHL